MACRCPAALATPAAHLAAHLLIDPARGSMRVHPMAGVHAALFLVGYGLSWTIFALHTRHGITQYHPGPSPLLRPWLPVVGALSSVFVGMSYIYTDKRTKTRMAPAPAAAAGFLRRLSVSSHPWREYNAPAITAWIDWRRPPSKRGILLRCLGALTGINYAVSKDPKPPLVMSAALFALALALFWMLDRTFRGFLISGSVAAIGTCVSHALAIRGYLAFVQPDLLGGTIKSWVPVILFTSAVCVGSTARVLRLLVDPPPEMILSRRS